MQKSALIALCLNTQDELIHAVVIRDCISPGWMLYLVDKNGAKLYLEDSMGFFISFNSTCEALSTLKEIIDGAHIALKVFKIDVARLGYFDDITHLLHC